MYDAGQLFDMRDLEVCLVGQGDLRGARHDEMGLEAALPQQFEQAHAIDRARSTADADDETWLIGWHRLGVHDGPVCSKRTVKHPPSFRQPGAEFGENPIRTRIK